MIDRFTTVVGLDGYAIYVFDYGAPVGFRLATRHPERIAAITSQNGNAYEEGLSQGWNPIQRYWTEPTPENRTTLRDFLTPEATRSQYVYGVPDESLLAPESYALETARKALGMLARLGLLRPVGKGSVTRYVLAQGRASGGGPVPAASLHGVRHTPVVGS